MAKLKFVNKKAEALTGQKPEQEKYTDRFFVKYKNHTISWRPNGRITENVEATNFYVIKDGMQDDTMSDYFAGSFFDNIQKAVKSVDYYDTAKNN